jgi:hypothetical protein
MKLGLSLKDNSKLRVLEDRGAVDLFETKMQEITLGRANCIVRIIICSLYQILGYEEH